MTDSKRQQQFDFYILQSMQYLRFTCRLLSKAYHQHYRAIVFCEDEDTAQEFDRMLWTFKDISFIPHQVITSNDDIKQTPISIWTGRPDDLQHDTADYFDLAVCLTPHITPEQINCPRIAYIVPEEDDFKQTARYYYKQLQQQSAHVQVHKINE